MYKIVCCNLGYDDLTIAELDGYTGSFDEVMEKLEELHFEDWDNMDGYEITKISYPKDGNFDSWIVIETPDYNKCIYIDRL